MQLRVKVICRPKEIFLRHENTFKLPTYILILLNFSLPIKLKFFLILAQTGLPTTPGSSLGLKSATEPIMIIPCRVQLGLDVK